MNEYRREPRDRTRGSCRNIAITFLITLINATILLDGCGQGATNGADTPEDVTGTTTGLARDISSFRSEPSASAYYIDGVGGNDGNDGRSPASAWKTLDRLHSVVLKPGDVVRLARGSVWRNQCILLDNGSSGTGADPVIIEAYGSGELPTIDAPRALWDKGREWPGVSLGRDGTVLKASSWIRVLDVRVTNLKGSGIAMSGETSDILVAGCEVSGCAMGVSIAGERQRVIGCYVHDGVMALDTGDPDRDWGANGVGVRGKDIEIAWNRFVRCIAPSKSFGTDGGAVEFFGYEPDTGALWDYESVNIAIHHNAVIDGDCFIEALGKARGMTIAWNLYESERPGALIFHLNSIRDDARYEVAIANNTFVCKGGEKEGWGIVGLLVDWNRTTAPNLADSRFVVRDNVFVTDYAIMSWINPIGMNLVHDHNVISLVDGGKLSVNSGVWNADGEILADPAFVGEAESDYRLSPGSPALAAGVPVSGIHDAEWAGLDLAGKTVPSRTVPDAGAFGARP